MKKIIVLCLSLIMAFLLFSSCNEQKLQEGYSDIISAFAECNGKILQTNINIDCEINEDNVMEIINFTNTILNDFSFEHKSTNINNNDNLFLYTVTAGLNDQELIKINSQSRKNSNAYINTKISSNIINESLILKTLNLSTDLQEKCKSVKAKMEITSIYDGRISKEEAKQELFKSISNKRLIRALKKRIIMNSNFSDYDNKTYITYVLDII